MRTSPHKPRDPIYAVATKIAEEAMAMHLEGVDIDRVVEHMHASTVAEANAYGQRLKSIVLDLCGKAKRRKQ